MININFGGQSPVAIKEVPKTEQFKTEKRSRAAWKHFKELEIHLSVLALLEITHAQRLKASLAWAKVCLEKQRRKEKEAHICMWGWSQRGSRTSQI